MGDAPPFTRTPAIDDLRMGIAEHVGALGPASPLSASPRLHRELRTRTIRSSLMIAGSTLSHDAVTAIVDGKRVLGPAREIREVKNANRAHGLVEELDPSSLADLLRAHGVMMDGLIDDAGRFRDALLPYTATVARLGADDRTDRALTFLAAHPAVTVTDPADHLGCSRRTAERVIATLRASGGLVREGSAPS